jgi:hypothetical protein
MPWPRLFTVSQCTTVSQFWCSRDLLRVKIPNPFQRRWTREPEMPAAIMKLSYNLADVFGLKSLFMSTLILTRWVLIISAVVHMENLGACKGKSPLLHKNDICELDKKSSMKFPVFLCTSIKFPKCIKIVTGVGHVRLALHRINNR